MLYERRTMGYKIFGIIPAIRKNKFPQNFTAE